MYRELLRQTTKTLRPQINKHMSKEEIKLADK